MGIIMLKYVLICLGRNETMRLRNVRGSKEAMIASEYVFTEPESLLNKWGEIFGNNNPIRIEIGMG